MEDVKQFKPFRETYHLITMALKVGLIYPKPQIELFRILAIPFVILTISPMAFMVLVDMYNCCLNRDAINIIRHSTVLGPFLGAFFKMILLNYKRKEGKQILDEIDRDYESYNYMTEEYKKITSNGVKSNRIYSERWWFIIVLTVVMTLPVLAVVQSVYSYIFSSEPVKYMIHDLKIPFREPELRFKTPIYEIMFVYMLYGCILYCINFVGYDGFFGLAVNHACLKIEWCCKALEDAMRSHDVHGGIVRVIREHSRMFQFVDLIQDTFNIWLALIFMATIIEICTCMYHITEGHGIDIRYMVFMCGGVVHVYLPCRYSAKLKAMSIESSSKIYCCGWETVNDLRVRKMVMFMVARTQIPIEISALKMVVFDMELFVSILQTSYSLYTLLSS